MDLFYVLSVYCRQLDRHSLKIEGSAGIIRNKYVMKVCVNIHQQLRFEIIKYVYEHVVCLSVTLVDSNGHILYCCYLFYSLYDFIINK